jgi:crotonobetainyl-CoA:carnitine CoA-transferase CaiB-like acyl-CoA transferase
MRQARYRHHPHQVHQEASHLYTHTAMAGNMLTRNRLPGLVLAAVKHASPLRPHMHARPRVATAAYSWQPVLTCRPMSSTPSTRLASAATQKSTPKQPLPLDGITVVSLEQAIAAPFCTRQLADLGARVIKVERPGVGDFARAYDTRVNGMASHFIWTNRSKESLALDLKSPEDLAVLMKLLEKTDVLVQNLAPGASDRLGLSYEKLQKKLPSLIVCDISGYGQDGPYRDKKAYDLLIQSEAGILSTTGTPSEPAKVGISIADISAGMYAYTNILAAIMQRGKTGLGSKIDISMLESMAEWMGFPLYYTYNNAPAAKPSGAAHATIYPYGPFECGEGTVMFGIQNEREFANFCQKVLGNGDFASDPRFATNSARVVNRDELKNEIDAVFSKLSASEVIEKLDQAAIANASVNDMQGVWNHPQLRARNRWTEVDTPTGRVPALLPPGTGEGVKARMDAVPSVGQHTESILAELGISR